MPVRVVLPSVLWDDAGGQGEAVLDVSDTAQVRDVLAALALKWPVLGRRIRDDTGTIRRHVNIFVDGDDIRSLSGDLTPVQDCSIVHVLPSVAGG